MRKINDFFVNKNVFIGLDFHKKSWSLTARCEGAELKKWTMPANKDKLVSSLKKLFPGAKLNLVYEAGCFGYWLYDYLVQNGIHTQITPPNLIPKEATFRAKNDTLDSRKLALFFEKGLLKKIAIPDTVIRSHRAVIRHRRQISKDKRRIENQIHSMLLFHGIEIDLPAKGLPKYSIDNLYRLKFKDTFFQESLHLQLDRLVETKKYLAQQTRLVRKLANSEYYDKKVTLLRSIPGVGILTAIEILVELFDVERFPSARKLSVYLGLTPQEYSTGGPENARMGHITKAGHTYLRSLFVEAAWRAYSKDMALLKKYTLIRNRRGNKIAIVAIARILAIRVRHILINNEEYALGVA